jgi:hypothetical protein
VCSSDLEEPVAEEADPDTTSESDEELPGGSLDEIMERVSKLVEETEAAIAVPEPCAPESTSETPAETVAEDLVDEIMEEPIQQATGTDS